MIDVWLERASVVRSAQLKILQMKSGHNLCLPCSLRKVSNLNSMGCGGWKQPSANFPVKIFHVTGMFGNVYPFRMLISAVQ